MTPPTRPDGDPLHNEDVAHEHSDINVRAILMFLVGLAGVTALAAAAMWGVFVVLENQAADNDPQLSPLSQPAGQQPPEPRLQTNEPAALDEVRSAEQKTLQGYGWVDQPAGVARVPIGEAKKLLLQRGVATRTGEPLDPRLGTRRSAMSDASSGRNAVVPQKAGGH